MSILIDELKANQDNFVLVSEVIKMMVDATSSKTDEVVKYLRAHKIDEKMMSFYMNEFYDFEPNNDSYFGNDTNTTYLQKCDLQDFEPITKHGLFKDRALPTNLIHDVYGRTYDVNQHKKNREDEYLPISESINFLNYNAVKDTKSFGSSYDIYRLRDLARKKKITPCFYFDGYVGTIRGERDEDLYTELVSGYFTYRLLIEDICRFEDYITLPSCEAGNEITIYRILNKKTGKYVDNDDGIFLFEKKPQGLHDAEKVELKCIEPDEIRFSKSDLTNYINSIQPNNSDDYFIEHAKLVDDDKLKQLESLKTENDDLNARLSIARNTYKQHQNEIKALKEKNEKLDTEKAELIKQLSSQADTPANDSILQTILNESHEHHAPDLKHAIQLWNDLYINKLIGTDSHSNRADIWIGSNTGYAENARSSIGRIREIATPLKDFGAKRSKEIKK